MFAIMEKLIEKYSGQATEKIFMKNVLQYSMLEDHIKK